MGGPLLACWPACRVNAIKIKRTDARRAYVSYSRNVEKKKFFCCMCLTAGLENQRLDALWLRWIITG